MFRFYGLGFMFCNTLINSFNNIEIKVKKCLVKCFRILRVYGLAFRVYNTLANSFNKHLKKFTK